MTKNISQYTLVNKRLTGKTLKLFFSRTPNISAEMVLELANVAAFIDNYNISKTDTLYLSIGNTEVYGLDMSMRLKQPELKDYQEVLLSSDAEFAIRKFRGIAEKINWRKFDDYTYGDKNY